MSTLEEIQQSWHERWSDEPGKKLPSCYNRPAWVSTVRSKQFFDLVYPFRMTEGCPHWKEGGNAHIRPYGDGEKGQRFEWADCDGCKWKV